MPGNYTLEKAKQRFWAASRRMGDVDEALRKAQLDHKAATVELDDARAMLRVYAGQESNDDA